MYDSAASRKAHPRQFHACDLLMPHRTDALVRLFFFLGLFLSSLAPKAIVLQFEDVIRIVETLFNEPPPTWMDKAHCSQCGAEIHRLDFADFQGGRKLTER